MDRAPEQKLDSRPDWTGTGQNGLVRVLGQVAFFVSPGPFFLKRIGKLRIVTSLSEQTGAHLSTRGWLSARAGHTHEMD